VLGQYWAKPTTAADSVLPGVPPEYASLAEQGETLLPRQSAVPENEMEGPVAPAGVAVGAGEGDGVDATWLWVDTGVLQPAATTISAAATTAVRTLLTRPTRSHRAIFRRTPSTPSRAFQ
jgi:hypothetical protein